jgi:HK97 family phage major capsid protein
MDLSEIHKTLGGLEAKLATFSELAAKQMETAGKVDVEVKAAVDALGLEQKAFAERMLVLEQRQSSAPEQQKGGESLGKQFVNSNEYKSSYAPSSSRGARHVSVELKNTVTNAIAATQPMIRPGVVGGAVVPMSIEALLGSVPTDAPSIRFVQESAFTNNAAEVAESAAKPQSAITFSEVTVPVETVAHWLKISDQMAKDNALTAGYIDSRLRYGVDLRVDGQLLNGNGTSPNLAGLRKTGNFVAHGYTAASLTSLLGAAYTRIDLIRKVMSDLFLAGYPATSIILNPGDWSTIELLKDSTGRYLVGDPSRSTSPALWGVPVIQSVSMPADNFLVGNYGLAGTKYDREAMTVKMFDQDENNAQLNLITLRAERRLCLAVDTPAASRGGDLTPA